MWPSVSCLPSWHNSAPASDPDRQTKKIEDYRPGYPRYTALISAYDRFFLCRRFDKLRARLLLSKQDRLSALEQQLEQVDREETHHLFLGRSRGDANQDRTDLLREIDLCLTDYDVFTERTSRVLSYDNAQGRDIEALHNWLVGNGSIAEEETEYLTYSEDLVSLATVKDTAVARLEDWVEDKVIRLFHRHHTGYQNSLSIDPNVYIHPGALISRSAKGLLLLLVTFLLLMPIVMCNMVSTISGRIVIIIASTILYLVVLVVLTRARTIELILAGATYATVLIVFVSGTSVISS